MAFEACHRPEVLSDGDEPARFIEYVVTDTAGAVRLAVIPRETAAALLQEGRCSSGASRLERAQRWAG